MLPQRFLAYIGRAARVLKVAAVKGSRYVAYSSDVGEAFRPVATPLWVKASYGVAWAYIVGDVAWQSRKAQQQGFSQKEVARVGCEEAVFQLGASLLIPSVIIHQGVHLCQKHVPRYTTNPALVKWSPVALGLGLIPFMPFFDEPVEHAVEWAFDQAWPHEEGHEEKFGKKHHGGDAHAEAKKEH
jgi:fission process protein 1